MACFLALAHRQHQSKQDTTSWLSKAVEAIEGFPSEPRWTRGELPLWSWRLVGKLLRHGGGKRSSDFGNEGLSLMAIRTGRSRR